MQCRRDRGALPKVSPGAEFVLMIGTAVTMHLSLTVLLPPTTNANAQVQGRGVQVLRRRARRDAHIPAGRGDSPHRAPARDRWRVVLRRRRRARGGGRRVILAAAAEAAAAAEEEEEEAPQELNCLLLRDCRLLPQLGRSVEKRDGWLVWVVAVLLCTYHLSEGFCVATGGSNRRGERTTAITPNSEEEKEEEEEGEGEKHV